MEANGKHGVNSDRAGIATRLFIECRPISTQYEERDPYGITPKTSNYALISKIRQYPVAIILICAWFFNAWVIDRVCAAPLL